MIISAVNQTAEEKKQLYTMNTNIPTYVHCTLSFIKHYRKLI